MLAVAVCGQWSVPPDCSSALLGKNWSARGGEREGVWTMDGRGVNEVSQNFTIFREGLILHVENTYFLLALSHLSIYFICITPLCEMNVYKL